MSSASKIGNKPFQRSGNHALVLRALRDRPGLTRTELAELLRIDRSTVSNITSAALEMGLICEHSQGDSGPRGGRKPISLRLLNERICALGIEVEPDSYRAVVSDNAGTTIYRENGELNAERFKAELTSVARRIATEMIGEGIPVLGVGYGIPGSVDSRTGRIFRSRALGIEDIYLDPSITVSVDHAGVEAGGSAGTIEIPVAIDTDANCCTWGELHAHRGAAVPQQLLFVLLRRNANHVGLGLGLVMGGELQHRETATHGEFYTYGWRGQKRSQFSLSREELLATADDRTLRRRFFDELIENLTPAVSLVNPEVVVLGGELRECFQEFLERIRTDFSEGYIRRFLDYFTIRPSVLGEDEVAGGAAGMYLERLFQVPSFNMLDDPFSISWDRVSPILEHYKAAYESRSVCH